MHTVEEILKNKLSVEEKYKKETISLSWEYTDVLFSFRGIYVIGLGIYYNEDFKWCKSTLKPVINSLITRQKAYSRAFLKDNYSKYDELNDLVELKEFIEVYQSIGNLIPIWPGGNVHRGQSNCYDLPNIYFNRSVIKKYAENFFSVFYNREDIYLDDVIHGRYSNIKIEDLSKFTKNEYKEFLIYITTVIKNREKLIKSWLLSNDN